MPEFPVTLNIFGLNGFDPARGFDPSQQTFVITHGYRSSGSSQWVLDKAQLLRQSNPNANIISVDWAEGAAPGIFGLDYPPAAANTRSLGIEIANQLIALGIDPARTQLIGHSLGAHASGFAGTEYTRQTGGAIASIIGLDPAGPLFEEVRSGGAIVAVPPQDRLDPSDATQVVALHTNPAFGNSRLLGDLDIFFNRDSLLQPGRFNDAGSHAYAQEVHDQILRGEPLVTESGVPVNLNFLATGAGEFNASSFSSTLAGNAPTVSELTDLSTFTALSSRLAEANQGSVNQQIFTLEEGQSTPSFTVTAAISEAARGGVIGTTSAEELIGSQGSDFLLSLAGADVITGQDGNDVLFGGEGQDTISGENGDDIINGNTGDDLLRGGPGADYIRGGQNNDQLFGDGGNDLLVGDRGTDILTGGAGADTFVLRTDRAEVVETLQEADQITDFNAAEGDRIALTREFPVSALNFQAIDVDSNGALDTVLTYASTRYSSSTETFLPVTFYLGTVLNQTVGAANTQIISLPAGDPLL
ncbi:MAG: hypothetical protein AAF889_06825 [Cyanobacteria bacterium P01_D01_bin.73]